MRKPARQKVIIIGCGNVAWHIAAKLHELDRFSLEVYNHRPGPALRSFAVSFRARTAASLNGVSTDGQYYFICVPDRFIAEVASRIVLRNPGAVLMHTAGSIQISELGNRVHGCGVFYPLQTFSKPAKIDWSAVPIITEASDPHTARTIDLLAHLFSNQVVALSYRQRLKLHLAAVLVNNFSNALYVAAQDLLRNEKPGKEIDFELLRPLIGQTTAKLEHMSPLEAQTGPARRNDKPAMARHERLLAGDPDLLKLYRMMSRLIIKQQRSLHDKF